MEFRQINLHNLPALFLLSLIFFLSACQTEEDGKREITRGKKLAEMHCKTCHVQPDPSMLDKKTWRDGVLPAMAEQFGIEVLQGNVYLPHQNSALSGRDWQAIVAYYETLAPETLIRKKPGQLAKDGFVFQIRKPHSDTAQTASTTMIRIDPHSGAIYTSDLNNPGLSRWNRKLEAERVLSLPSSAVDITFKNEEGNAPDLITCMGGMRALDATKGNVIRINRRKGKKIQVNDLGGHFTRPIQSRPIDFNRDGLTDYIVCSFGHNQGGLYLLKQLPDETFEKVPVREVPGATQAVTGDFNQDGWPDIMALFAHADEGIWLFLNDHKGGFITKNVLRFPPVYGSSSFQLVDMNRDGKHDIVYTAGDNSDYSRILKPYHGLYIFINQGDLSGGHLQFKQAGFYPIHGATKVIARDFDLDGDMDLATIAFFADFQNNPSESFICFEQNSTKLFPDFTAHAVPVSTAGRWICMDAEDLDGDGDSDIVLGNFSRGFMNQETNRPLWDTNMPFIVLENGVRVTKPANDITTDR